MLWRPIRCLPRQTGLRFFALKHAPRITLLGDPPEELLQGKVFDSETGPLADFFGYVHDAEESCLIWRTEASTLRTAGPPPSLGPDDSPAMDRKNESRAGVMATAIILCPSVAAVTVALRIYERRFLARVRFVEDYCIAAAMTCSIIMSVFMGICMSSHTTICAGHLPSALIQNPPKPSSTGLVAT